MHRIISKLTFLIAMMLSCSAIAVPKVVTSIKPIHGLTAAIMQGVGEPIRLVPDGSSPHTFVLKPSQIAKLQQADVVIWVGPDLEAFLQKPLDLRKDQSLTLLNLPQLRTLPMRQGKGWSHDYHDHHGHHHGHVDAHIWLSPENAMVIADAIASKLSELDAKNAQRYQDNLSAFKTRLLALKQELYLQLETLQGQGFLVFHDAYQYFEASFSLKASGSITVHPDVPLSGAVLQRIRQQIQQDNIQCVFYEPEFSHQAIDNVLSDLSIKAQELDPLGARIEAGPEFYEQLLRRMVHAISECSG
jgi:zinc transport system substrate-binding protein